MKRIKPLHIFLTTASTAALAFTYCSQTHPIQAKGPVTKTLFKFLSKYDEKYSKFLLKFLLRYQLVCNRGSMQLGGKILREFDQDGACLRGLELMGFGGVQVGPVSLKVGGDGERLGALFVKSNINAFLEQFHSDDTSEQANTKSREKQKQNFKIGVSLIPDDEILEYTPYLIQENLQQAFNKIATAYQPSPEQPPKTTNPTTPTQPSPIPTPNPTTTTTPIPQQTPLPNPTLLSFLTINTDTILQKTDSQIHPQLQQIITKFFNKISPFSKQHNIQLYQVREGKYQGVGYSAADQSGIGRKSTGEVGGMDFVTWREVVDLIIL